MLCCRPMLALALAAAFGAVAARFLPEAAGSFQYGWLLFLILSVWFLLTPGPVPPDPEGIPDGYAAHILPRPGYLARRGLNRLVLILCLPAFLFGAARQQSWSASLSEARPPEPAYFGAAFRALAPNREFIGQGGDWRVPALLLAVDGKPCDPVAVSLSGGDGEGFRRGDVVEGRVRRGSVSRKAFPGAFDFGFWLERDGLAGSLRLVAPRSGDGVRYSVLPVDDPPAFTRLRRLVDTVRAHAIAETLKHGGESGALLAAMLYGYRKNIEPVVRDSFRRVGIGHVLAISGLHVGLIVGLLWWTSGWFGWDRRWRAAACLVLVLFYLGLSGGQVAASRATCMAAIHLACIVWGRRGDMMNSLGAAAFILILLNPTAPLDVSFQLSFTAVVFIYLALGGRPDRDKPRTDPGWNSPARRLLREANSLLRLSVATWVGLFPIIAAVFNQVNLVGLVINIVVIPLMSLVLAGGLLVPWLAWLPGAAWFLALPTRCLVRLAAAADALPYSSFPAHAPADGWLFLFYVCVFLFLLRGMLRRSSRLWIWDGAVSAGLALTCAGLILSMRSAPPPEGGRIAHLPGSGMGLIAVQSADGGAALLGSFSRGGLLGAEWLHYVRYGGGVSVVALGQTSENSLAALDWHFPVGRFVGHPATDRDDIGVSGWREVPGVAGAEYAISREAKGGAVWLAVRAGGKSICVAPRLAERQLTYRLERKVSGGDADLFLIGFTKRGSGFNFSPFPRGRVGLLGEADFSLPYGWFRRSGYGALLLADPLLGFDGEKWVVIR